MARATKALITRQDLIDMANDGEILLRPGTGIENSGLLINRALSREEIVQFAYIDGNPYDRYEDGSEFYIRQISTGEESFGPPPGFTNDVITTDRFIPNPAVGGILNNGGTIVSVNSAVPTDKNRMTHYGVDARFHDTILSPAVDLYGKTVHLTNSRADQGLFTATLTVTRRGTPSPIATYSRSSVGSTDLSGNIRLGNFINLSLIPPSVWPTGGTLILEVFENTVLHFSKSLTIAAYSTGSLSIAEYPIKFGINYEFKGRSSMVTAFDGAFSNVTGQRACNLL